eukprot:229908-Pleurochrysis_carterae.AAC.1
MANTLVVHVGKRKGVGAGGGRRTCDFSSRRAFGDHRMSAACDLWQDACARTDRRLYRLASCIEDACPATFGSRTLSRRPSSSATAACSWGVSRPRCTRSIQ